MKKITLENARIATQEWLLSGLSINDPYHALRCAAFALYDVGLLENANLLNIIEKELSK